MRKTCRNVFTALTTAEFLSANMFSFPTLEDLKIVDGNLLACQAEFNLRCIPSHISINLASLHQDRFTNIKRHLVFPTIKITFNFLSSCSVLN